MRTAQQSLSHSGTVLISALPTKIVILTFTAKSCMQEYNAALTDLMCAAEISPDDKSIAAEIARVNRARESEKQKQAATYKSMFS